MYGVDVNVNNIGTVFPCEVRNWNKYGINMQLLEKQMMLIYTNI